MVPCPADYSHVYVELGIFISSAFFFFLWTFLQFAKDIQKRLLA